MQFIECVDAEMNTYYDVCKDEDYTCVGTIEMDEGVWKFYPWKFHTRPLTLQEITDIAYCMIDLDNAQHWEEQ